MPETRLKVSLHPSELEALRAAAERRQMTAAMLATRFVQEGLANEQGADAGVRPSAKLLEWLHPQLVDLRETGDWPSDITIRLFARIGTEVPALYAAAAAELGNAALNREIGRFVREGLQARPIMRDGAPHFKRLSRARQGLITGATLLEPAI